MVLFTIIVAVDRLFGIGKNGQLPWRIPGEINYFKEMTTRRSESGLAPMVIMGRKTWDSLPEKFRPLPERENIVLSRFNLHTLPNSVAAFDSLDSAFKQISRRPNPKIFIIGGAQLFSEVITLSNLDEIYLTKIDHNFNCDVFFPKIPEKFKKTYESDERVENDLSYRFFRFSSRLERSVTRSKL